MVCLVSNTNNTTNKPAAFRPRIKCCDCNASGAGGWKIQADGTPAPACITHADEHFAWGGKRPAPVAAR